MIYGCGLLLVLVCCFGVGCNSLVCGLTFRYWLCCGFDLLCLRLAICLVWFVCFPGGLSSCVLLLLLGLVLLWYRLWWLLLICCGCILDLILLFGFDVIDCLCLYCLWWLVGVLIGLVFPVLWVLLMLYGLVVWFNAIWFWWLLIWFALVTFAVEVVLLAVGCVGLVRWWFGYWWFA